MQPNELDNFMNLLFAELLNRCPKDTGNMVNHILIGETEDYYEITITAPKDNYDYARSVNYALNAKADGRALSVKEAKNYRWIEKAIARSTEVFTGDIPQVELNDI